MRRGFLGLLAVALAIAGTPASAQVRDAVYRGTMVCDKFPFSVGNGREAIEVTITGGAVRYTHAVRLACTAAPTLGERLPGRSTATASICKGHGRAATANTRQNTAGRSSGVTPVSKARNLERRRQNHQPDLFWLNQAAFEAISATRKKVSRIPVTKSP